MASIKPKDLELIRIIEQFDKPYWTVSDLEKVLHLKRECLHVALHRLVKAGVLQRLRRGIYQLAGQPPDVPRIANALYLPSYLSFESALARYGILSQIPYTVTFATPRRSKRMTVGETIVEFRQMRADLCFGYYLEQGLYIAEREKALLDALYLMKRGRLALPLDELYLADIAPEKLLVYAHSFPPYVRQAVHALLQ